MNWSTKLLLLSNRRLLFVCCRIRVLCATLCNVNMDSFYEENIYNLIPKEPVKEEKSVRYKSKFATLQQNGNDTKMSRTAYRTMGPARTETRPPDHFLKSHEKDPKLPQRQEFKYPDESRRRPAVPRRDERPVMATSSNKDFIVENAMENITAQPKFPKRIYVDSRKGDKQLLDPSGLQPVFLNKKDYGKAPDYLKRIKDEMKESQEEMRRYYESCEKRDDMRRVTEEEREILIKGLKNKWESLYKDYLTLPMVVDTPPKKAMKEQLENELQQLEKDVKMIESYKSIFIAE